MEDPTTRKTRLQALRAAATAAGGGEDGDGAALVEPVLKFRNYAPAADERIQHEKLEPARVPEFEEVKVDADAVLVGDAEVCVLACMGWRDFVDGGQHVQLHPTVAAWSCRILHGIEPQLQTSSQAATALQHHRAGLHLPAQLRPPTPRCAPTLLQEVLINVAPKKANWDLRRDIADKLARLERQTQVRRGRYRRSSVRDTASAQISVGQSCLPHRLLQGAMIKLTQQENQLREEGAK